MATNTGSNHPILDEILKSPLLTSILRKSATTSDLIDRLYSDDEDISTNNWSDLSILASTYAGQPSFFDILEFLESSSNAIDEQSSIKQDKLEGVDYRKIYSDLFDLAVQAVREGKIAESAIRGRSKNDFDEVFGLPSDQFYNAAVVKKEAADKEQQEKRLAYRKKRQEEIERERAALDNTNVEAPQEQPAQQVQQEIQPQQVRVQQPQARTEVTPPEQRISTPASGIETNKVATPKVEIDTTKLPRGSYSTSEEEVEVPSDSTTQQTLSQQSPQETQQPQQEQIQTQPQQEQKQQPVQVQQTLEQQSNEQPATAQQEQQVASPASDPTTSKTKKTNINMATTTKQQPTNTADISTSGLSMDKYFAQRKETGTPLTATQIQALDPDSYSRLWWKNNGNTQAIADAYENAYTSELGRLEEERKKNTDLSERVDGNIVGEKSIYTFPTVNRGATLRDKNALRYYAASGDDKKFMESVGTITGLDFSQYASPEAAMTAMKERDEQLVAEYSNADTTDERRVAIKEEHDRLQNELDTLQDAMKFAGYTADENGLIVRPSALTAEELLQPRTKPLSKEEMEYRQQKNTLQHKKIGRGIADLVRGLGNSIQSISGAKVADHDFDKGYKDLDTRGQQLYQLYLARQEQQRKEQLARETAAATAMRDYQQKLALQKSAHEDRMKELELKGEIENEKVDKLLEARIFQQIIKTTGASTNEELKAAKVKARELAKTGKYENATEVGGRVYYFDKNLGNSNLVRQIVEKLKSSGQKVDEVYTNTDRTKLQSYDPIATLGTFVAKLASKGDTKTIELIQGMLDNLGVIYLDSGGDPATASSISSAITKRTKPEGSGNGTSPQSGGTDLLG